jgi:hypothetical protein
VLDTSPGHCCCPSTAHDDARSPVPDSPPAGLAKPHPSHPDAEAVSGLLLGPGGGAKRQRGSRGCPPITSCARRRPVRPVSALRVEADPLADRLMDPLGLALRLCRDEQDASNVAAEGLRLTAGSGREDERAHQPDGFPELLVFPRAGRLNTRGQYLRITGNTSERRHYRQPHEFQSCGCPNTSGPRGYRHSIQRRRPCSRGRCGRLCRCWCWRCWDWS